MPDIQIPHNFIPRDYQSPLYNALPAGFKRGAAVWHRRAGKDKTFMNIIAREMAKRVGTYFYILPYFKQARLIVWEGRDGDGFKFIDHIPPAFVKRKENQQMVLEAHNGSVLRMIGSDNIDSIVGTNPVGVLFSEYSLHKPQAWDYLRPILVENGGWSLFNFTPRGMNHAHKMWAHAVQSPDWFSQILTVEDTRKPDGSPVVTLADIEKERQDGMPEELVQQEFYCSFEAGLVGAYYADQMKVLRDNKQIRHVPYDPAVPVDTWWDLGLNDTNVLWFVQHVGREVHVIHCYGNRNKALPHYVKYMQGLPFVYGTHYLPHDIKAREYSTNQKRIQTLYDLGVSNVIVVPKAPIQEGVNATRQILPRCFFDLEGCFTGIEALKSYRRKYDNVNDTFLNIPIHDWASHYADAFRTGTLMCATGSTYEHYQALALGAPGTMEYNQNPLYLDQRQMYVGGARGPMYGEIGTSPDNMEGIW